MQMLLKIIVIHEVQEALVVLVQVDEQHDSLEPSQMQQKQIVILEHLAVSVLQEQVVAPLALLVLIQMLLRTRVYLEFLDT